MPKATVREAATGLPKAINRRSILGALAGVPAALALPAAAMAGAPAALAALSAQTVVSPAPSAASATKEEAAGSLRSAGACPTYLTSFGMPFRSQRGSGAVRRDRPASSKAAEARKRRSEALV